MHTSASRIVPALARVAAALAALLVAGLVAVLPARPAAAAGIGPGWGPQDNGGLGFVGAFVVGGRQVYCLEPALEAPLGATSPLGYGGWGAASPDDLARASWAIATTGQSSDPRDAVAVNLYVWSLLAPVAYAAHGVPGDDWYADYVPDPADRAETLARLAALRAGGASVAAVAGTGAGALSITIDPVDEYRGSVVVSALEPASATGALVLEHAVFDATGTASIAGVGAGAVLAITAIPPSGPAPYRVSVDGAFAAAGWRGEIERWATPDAQTLAGSGRASDLVFPLAGSDDRDRSVLFQPIVTTRALQQRIEPGGRFADLLRFELAPDADGRVNRWYRTAAGHLPITASCRLYGPFAASPAPAPSPPAGAPLASSFVVTTGPDGPDADYVVDSEQPLTAAGWYTAQCSIDAGSQPAATRPYLPPGYRFEDAFGVAAESALVPFLPAISTAFPAATAVPGARVVDAVTISVAAGPWPLDAGGEPMPVELEGRFTVVGERPVRAGEPPAGAEEIAVQRIVAAGPGTYSAEPVTIPAGSGWLVARWCVLEGEAVRPSCDDWGAPGEIVEFSPPQAPPAPPRLAATGTDGSALALGAGLAMAVIGSGTLLRLAAGPRRRPRRRRTTR
ncbi:MAG: hypothetical protein BGO95_04850 [Micrococcales bacterium 73-13]|nr:MAG: hypothetical protein BGO95_04850 [Micrococcales bacterium 73-13]